MRTLVKHVFLFASLLTQFYCFSQNIEHSAGSSIYPDLGDIRPSELACDYLEKSGHNYVSNYQFDINNHTLEFGLLDSSNPFALGQISNWVETHGTPGISDFLYPITTMPSGINNYASMYSWVNGENLYSEGIAQKISKLDAGKQYNLTFFKKLADESFTYTKSMDKFFIVLMHCQDYPALHKFPEYTLADLPALSQVIYVDAVSNGDWEQVLTSFVADAEYDMVWIFAKQDPSVAAVLGVDFAGMFITNFVDGNFDCTQPLALSGCNYIPNPEFSKVNPTLSNYGAFETNNVSFWNDTHGTSDLNVAGGLVLSSPFSGVNAVSMCLGKEFFNTPNGISVINDYEGIAAKISSVTTGRKYAMSFFISSTIFPGVNPPQDVVFNVVLQNCNNFPNASQTNAIPALANPNQIVFCKNMGTLSTTTWSQVFITFTAEQDFDMIRVFPSQAIVPQTDCMAFVHFAYPELIDITDFNAGTFTNCTLGTGAQNCSVKNAEFIWKNPAGIPIYQGSNQSFPLDNNAAIGNYNLSMVVNNVTPENLLNCQGIATDINASLNVNNTCECGTLRIEGAQVQYLRFPQINGSNNWYTQTLNPCFENLLCYGYEEAEFFTCSSNMLNNNIWEARLVPGFGDANTIPYLQFNNIADNNPSLGNFHQISLTNNFDLILYTLGTYTFMIEIRLTNTVLNQSKSMYVKNIAPSFFHPISFKCVQSTPLNNFPHYQIVQENLPGFSYLWSFSAGITPLSPINNAQVEFIHNGFLANPTASVLVTNSYGCLPYTRTFNVHQNNCSTSKNSSSMIGSHSINSLSDFKNSNTLEIFPNPVSTMLFLESEKSIEEIILYSIDGLIIKKFKSVKIIPMDNLPSGIYILGVRFSDKSKKYEKVYKK